MTPAALLAAVSWFSHLLPLSPFLSSWTQHPACSRYFMNVRGMHAGEEDSATTLPATVAVRRACGLSKAQTRQEGRMGKMLMFRQTFPALVLDAEVRGCHLLPRPGPGSPSGHCGVAPQCSRITMGAKAILPSTQCFRMVSMIPAGKWMCRSQRKTILCGSWGWRRQGQQTSGPELGDWSG